MYDAVPLLDPVTDWVVWLSGDDRTADRDALPARPTRAGRADSSSIGKPPRASAAGRRVRLGDAEAAVLVERVQGGDEAAFRTIYVAFYRALWEFAYSLVGAGDAAEDVVQDVFAAWWERRETVRIGGLDPYLYGAVRHRAANWRRHEDVVHRDDVSATLAASGAGMGEQAPASDDVVQRTEFERALADAIARLPDQRRAALMLRVRHDLDYATIGEILGVSHAAAMIHVSRARTALRRVFETHYQA